MPIPLVADGAVLPGISSCCLGLALLHRLLVHCEGPHVRNLPGQVFVCAGRKTCAWAVTSLPGGEEYWVKQAAGALLNSSRPA